MKLQFEDSYVSGIFVGAKGKEGGAKKRYALLSDSGKYKITGFEYVRHDWSAIARNTQKTVLDILLSTQDTSKAFSYVKQVLASIKDQPLSDFVLKDRLSRDIDEYTTNLPHVAVAKKLRALGQKVGRGSFIEYVIVKGQGNLYEKALPVSQATLSQVDFDYYSTQQIIAVVSSIFDVFGLSFEKQKQTGLSSFF
jgi:DNA polymerase, archaea type